MGASCYVTIMIEDKHNHQYYGAFLCDDVGFLQRGIANDSSFSIKKCICATNGKELLDELNNAYGGLFTEFDENRLFEEEEGTNYKACYLRNDLEIDGKIGGQSEVEAMSTSQMKMMTIWEHVTDDECGSRSTLNLDFDNHIAHLLTKVFYDEGTQIIEKEINLDSDTEETIRDGFFEEDEEDYEDEE